MNVRFSTLILRNNNLITVNSILVYIYILKRTRLTLNMTTANCHVLCKPESSSDLNTFLCVRTPPISFIIIHDGIKDVVVNRKSEL